MAECPDCGCKLAQAFCPGCGRDMRGNQDARRSERTRPGHEPRGWARGARKVAEIEGVSPFIFHPDGRHVVTADPDRMETRLWTLSRGELVSAIRIATDASRNVRKRHVTSLSITPSGQYLAVHGGWETPATVWDLHSKSKVWSGDTLCIGPVVFSPTGDYLAMGHDDHTVIFAHAPFGPELEYYRTTYDCGMEGDCLVFSPDGRYLVTGTRTDKGGYGQVWDVLRARPLAELPDLKGVVTSAAFSPSGRLLATGEHDGPVRIWAMGTWQALAVLGNDKTKAVTFTPDSQFLVAGPGKWSPSDCIEIWGMESRDLVRRIGSTYETESRHSALSPDGSCIVGTHRSKAKATLWELRTGETLYDISWIDLDKAVSTQVGFSPSGRYLVVACEDGMSRIYEQSE